MASVVIVNMFSYQVNNHQKNHWVIDAYDPLMRLECEDEPVPHGTSLIIKHGLTGQERSLYFVISY